MKFMEEGPGLRSGLRDLPRSLNAGTIGSGLVSAIFGCTGPAMVIISAAVTVGFSAQDTASWLFSVYVFGGLIGCFLSLYYKIPIAGAYAISAATLMATALAGYTFSEAAGAFVLAGIIVLILGLSGWIGKIIKVLPMEIVMAMVAGCMLKFGVNIVTYTYSDIVVCGLAVLAFLIVPCFLKKFPGVLAALIVGIIAAIVTGGFSGSMSEIAYIPPHLVKPLFEPSLVLSCAVPIAALVVGAEGAQAMGVLEAKGYKVPANSMTILSGIGGICTGLFGGHNANIAGPMTAICASEESGPKEGRYAASFVNGVTFILFGVLSSYAMSVINFIPQSLVYTIAGLAMINVLIGAFRDAFKSGKYKTGAFFALIIGVSGVSILKIGSAFWALVFGVLVSLICDRKDFKKVENDKNLCA